jgi:hypothetical protein
MTSSPSLVSKCTKTNRTISIDITSPIGTVTGAILNYSHNGIVQAPITMTNTSGTTWSGTILAPTVNVNAKVTWSITATNSLGNKAVYYGTSYSDEPNTGFSLTSTASSSTFCAGTNTVLSIDSNKNGTIVLGSGNSSSNASGISPFYHGHGGVAEFFERGGQQYIYAEDLLTLGQAKTMKIRRPKSGTVDDEENKMLVPPPEVLYGVPLEPDQMNRIDNRESQWKRAHLMPLRVPKGHKELPTLEQGKKSNCEYSRDL